jgi:hypothetical protein
MAINSSKLLPPSNSSGIVLSKSNNQNISKKLISSSDLLSSAEMPYQRRKKVSSQILIIKTQVIKIEKIVNGRYLEKIKSEKEKQKLNEKNRRKGREEKLEKSQEKEEKFPNVPKLPKLGFLDGIKNFIGNMILGFVAYRLIEHLPAIANFLKFLAPAVDFFIDFSGKLLDGLVTFVDWGYKAYDNTRRFLKNLGGENTLKVFDGFIGAMDKVIEASIIAAFAFSELRDTGGDSGGKKGATPGRRAKVTTSGGAPAGRSDIRNPLRQRPKVTTGKGGKLRLPKGIKSAGGLLGLMFLIPDLIDSGMLVSQGRGKDGLRTLLSAVAGTVAGIGAYSATIAGAGALGITGVGLPAAIALAIAGFAASSLAGTAAYNLADAGLRKMGLVDKDPSTGKPYAYRSGGPVTRGSEVNRGIARKTPTKKVQRVIRVQQKEVEPGKSIGGEKEIKKIFPEPESKDKSKTINPLGYMEKSHKEFSKIPGFGGLASIFVKAQLGEDPTKADYQSAAGGLESWMQKTFSDEVIRTGGAFAEGGEVDIGMFTNSSDMRNMIAKSLQDSIAPKIDETIKDLREQLMLKEIDRGKEPGEGPGAEDEPTGSPTLVGNTNAEKVFRYLVDKEGFTPEAAAGVIGNLMQESGVNPKSRQLGGGPGRGIMQWTETERWASLTAWANNSGKDPWTLETQVEWMMKEMKDYGTYNRIKGVTSYKKAVEIFEKEMERAGVPNYPRRYQFAADALASFSGGAGGAGISLGSQKMGAVDQFTSIAKGFGLQLTSDYRPGDSGYHGKNRARDYSNDSVGRGTPQQLAFAKHLVQNYGSSLTQLIYTPLGFGIANGKKVGLDYWGESTNSQHYHHVHVALEKGGLVDGTTYAKIGEKGREFVLDSNTTEATRGALPGFLEALNSAKNVSDVLKVIRFYMPYESESPQQVIIENNPIQDIDTELPQNNRSFMMSGSGGGSSSDPFDILDRLPG